MSVNKGLDPIYTKKYLSPEKDWQRIKNMLPEYKDVLNIFDDCVDENMSKMNSNIIIKIRDILDLKTQIFFDEPTELKATERLVDICLKHNATTYISGISGSKYMDLNLFSDNNIKVVFQDETKMVKKPIIDILKNKI
jgi:hypothetical protein